MTQKRWLIAAITLFAAIIVIFAVMQFTAKPDKTTLTVSAAASLKDSLDQIKPLFEAQYPDIQLTFNYGASGTLQQQIEQGAPADLFISAGQKQMQALVDQSLIDPAKQHPLLANELVVVVPGDSATALSSVTELTGAELKKIAVGQPESVPAGTYAQQSLTASGIWDTLKDKLVFAKDVRQVLTYVETGNADAGFVYRTDAMTSDKVRIAFGVPADTHKPIVYPIGILKQSEHAKEAENLYDYLSAQEAQRIFSQNGFKLPTK